MKRILIFSLNYYPSYIGGAEVAIKEVTNRIETEEIEFHMVTLRFDSELQREERIGNVHVHRIGPVRPRPRIADLKRFPLHLNKYWYQVGAWLAAERLHRMYRFDGIWAMMAHSCAIPAGLFKLFHPRVRYLLTLQEGDPPEHIERMMRPVWPLFVRGFTSADALQPISTFLRDWGLRMGFTGAARVIPNAVDVERFTKAYTNEEISSMEKRLGKRAGEVFLVTTSRLVYKNGIDDVIRALPKMPEEVTFLVYGIGPDEEMLRALAKRHGVEERIRFMGQIGHEEMPLMLRACDIFIRPSRSEGMGNSFIEAMAAGLPVIATQEGGIADFLFDAVRNPDREPTGWAVRPNTPEDIAAAVKNILENPELVERVRKTALTMVVERYDWKGIAANMRTLFQELFSGKEHPHVLIATPLYPPEPGGPATYTKILEQKLPDKGFNVSIVKYIDVRHLPKLVRHFAYFYRMFQAARETDLILALDPVSTGLPAALAAVLRRRPYVVKVVGDYAWEQGCQRYGISSTLDAFVHERIVPPQVALLRWVQRTVAIHARQVIVPSEYLKRIVRTWGVPDEHITVIYNAVLPEEPGTVPEAVSELSRPRLVTAGRLVPWKGVGGVIAAVEQVRTAYPEASLIIVGDGPERASLEAYARARLKTGYVFTGQLSHQDTLAVIGDADLFVLNSTYEGLSHLLIEALSLGKPVVATRVGGNIELIEDEANGLLIEARDPAALVDACMRLLSDSELNKRLRTAALGAKEVYSVQTMIDRTAANIRSLV